MFLKYLTLLFWLCICSPILAQDDFLAKQYLTDGEYGKAVVFYEKLARQQPLRTDYAQNLVTCYQQLERYEDAEKFIQKKLDAPNPPPTWNVELGYNYLLQHKDPEAQQQFELAVQGVEQNPNYAYGVGTKFQNYAQLDYAIKTYTTAMARNPQMDYNFHLARIYGEQGNISKMYDHYLDLLQTGKVSKSNVLRNIEDFINEDPENPNNLSFKKVLLQRAQKDPDVLWNELLSWLYVQQKQYKSAFTQEKAVYKRGDGGSLLAMENLGNLALEDNETEVAKTIFQYIVDNAVDPVERLNANLNLIDISLQDPSGKNRDKVASEYQELLEQYGYDPNTLQLPIAYANFLGFRQEQPEEGIALLKKCLDLPLNPHAEGYVKMALGDILVYDQQFNQALIYFTQIQQKLKNDVLGQNARFKVAQTSFYKGDFDWALTQLKVLRGSTSQLIANDAMQLSLLIQDNTLEDSTQTALKEYARADLLAYQNKTKSAIDLLEDILQNHKGEKIEDEALFKQAELLEEQQQYEHAELNYRKIIEFYGDGILADDALFALGELYRTVLNQPEKAKEQYEKIIYNYVDSYYLPEARRQFRKLRGDTIE